MPYGDTIRRRSPHRSKEYCLALMQKNRRVELLEDGSIRALESIVRVNGATIAQIVCSTDGESLTAEEFYGSRQEFAAFTIRSGHEFAVLQVINPHNLELERFLLFSQFSKAGEFDNPTEIFSELEGVNPQQKFARALTSAIEKLEGKSGPCYVNAN